MSSVNEQPRPEVYPTTARISVATAQATAPFELSHLVRDRYMQALMWRTNSMSGPDQRSASSIMEECRNLYGGILSPAQEQIAADVAGVKLNFVREKADILHSWMLDVTNANMEQLITVNSTPNPELSELAREELREELWGALVAKLTEQGYQADEAGLGHMPPAVRNEITTYLGKAADELKSAAHAREKSLAETAAKAMERMITDQMIEAGFHKEYGAFLHDFCTRPVAILKAPVIESVQAPRWNRNKWSLTFQDKLRVRRVNPYNLVVSPDSTTTQNGAYLIERIPMRKDQLMAMSKSPYWIRENVIAALIHFEGGGPHDWLSVNPEQQVSRLAGWPLHQTIDCLQMHGLFTGRELERYNIGKGLDPLEFVEAVVTVIGPYVIQVRLQVVQQGGFRPYFSSSFKPSNDCFYGRGLPNLLADTQIAAYSAFWGLMRNSSYAAGARGEVDFTRISEFLTENATPEQVLAQPFHFTNPDRARTQGGASAFNFHTIPNSTEKYINLLQFLEKKADDESGVPAIAGGELQQATVGRAFRSVSMLYGAATKRIKQVLTHVDQTVLGPIGQAIYYYNMEHHLKDNKDFMRLDAAVVARGTSGLLEQELKNQAAVEALQAAPGLVQLAQAGGTSLPGGLINKIVANAAEGLGIDISSFPELNADTSLNKAVDKATLSNAGPQAPQPPG